MLYVQCLSCKDHVLWYEHYLYESLVICEFVIAVYLLWKQVLVECSLVIVLPL